MKPTVIRKLRLLSRATGAPMSRLVDTAVEEFVERVLRENTGIRERYQQADDQDRPRPTLKVVK